MYFHPVFYPFELRWPIFVKRFARIAPFRAKTRGPSPIFGCKVLLNEVVNIHKGGFIAKGFFFTVKGLASLAMARPLALPPSLLGDLPSAIFNNTPPPARPLYREKKAPFSMTTPLHSVLSRGLAERASRRLPLRDLGLQPRRSMWALLLTPSWNDKLKPTFRIRFLNPRPKSQATQPPLTPRQGPEYRGSVPDANP